MVVGKRWNFNNEVREPQKEPKECSAYSTYNLMAN
jgi:hypothetical protein